MFQFVLCLPARNQLIQERTMSNHLLQALLSAATASSPRPSSPTILPLWDPLPSDPQEQTTVCRSSPVPIPGRTGSPHPLETVVPSRWEPLSDKASGTTVLPLTTASLNLTATSRRQAPSRYPFWNPPAPPTMTDATTQTLQIEEPVHPCQLTLETFHLNDTTRRSLMGEMDSVTLATITHTWPNTTLTPLWRLQDQGEYLLSCTKVVCNATTLCGQEQVNANGQHPPSMQDTNHTGIPLQLPRTHPGGSM